MDQYWADKDDKRRQEKKERSGAETGQERRRQKRGGRFIRKVGDQRIYWGVEGEGGEQLG
jgi:hypothetical protein